MKKELSDYDLDVINLLNDFPEDNINSVLYLRGQIDKDNRKINPLFIFSRSNTETLGSMIFSLISTSEVARDSVLNAVLNYLNRHEDQKKRFVNCLK